MCLLKKTYQAHFSIRPHTKAAEGCDLLSLLLTNKFNRSQPSAAVVEAKISVLDFVIQGGVEVGALLQVFLGVALGVGFFAGDFNVGTGWQYHGGRDGGSGNHREEIEVHGGNPRVRLACLPGWAVKQT
jgi:hypothetical protein